MNIFVLDSDQKTCAQYHNDTHLNKMITETAQLLSTCIWYYEHKNNEFYAGLGKRGVDPEAREMYKEETGLYLPSHINHPVNVFVRKNQSNFKWTLKLFKELLDEYRYRKGKNQACIEKLPLIEAFDETQLPEGELKFVIGFNEETYSECIVDDVIESYRNYYNTKKGYYNRNDVFVEYEWTGRDLPPFFNR